MRISDLNKKSPVKTAKKTGDSGSASAAKKTNQAGSSQSQPQSVGRAGVSVSGTTGQISASMADYTAQRADKVATVKLEVDSGRYEPDSEKTAAKIVDGLTDYSLA